MICRPALVLAVALIATPLFAAEPPAKGGSIALHCTHLLDPAAGKLLGESTVVVRSGRIDAVHAGAPAADEGKPVELIGQTCLPGLIDAHTHLTSETSPT